MNASVESRQRSSDSNNGASLSESVTISLKSDDCSNNRWIIETITMHALRSEFPRTSRATSPLSTNPFSALAERSRNLRKVDSDVRLSRVADLRRWRLRGEGDWSGGIGGFVAMLSSPR